MRGRCLWRRAYGKQSRPKDGVISDCCAGPEAGLPGSTTEPLPVHRALGRALSTRASQDAADAGLAGSPLAYTSAGSLTQADSAEDGGPEAFGRARFGSFRRSLSYGSVRGGGLAGASPGQRAATLGDPDRGPEGGSGSARGPGFLARSLTGSWRRGQGAPDGAPARAQDGAPPDAPDQAPAPDAPEGAPAAPPPLPPLRTVTERSESLTPSAGDAGTPFTAQGGAANGAHGPLSAQVTRAGAAPGAPVGKAFDGGLGGDRGPRQGAYGGDPDKEFAEKRQVPPGKLAVLLLLFAGAPAAFQHGFRFRVRVTAHSVQHAQSWIRLSTAAALPGCKLYIGVRPQACDCCQPGHVLSEKWSMVGGTRVLAGLRRRAGLRPGEGADALREPGLLAGGVLHRAAGAARHIPGAPSMPFAATLHLLASSAALGLAAGL